MISEFKNKVDYILKTYADKTAITYMCENGTDEKYTFGEIGELISHINALLDKAGLAKGDRAAIVTPHSPYGVMAGIILAYLNITIVPIDVSLPIEEIEKLLVFSDVRAIFTTVEWKNKIDKKLTSEIPCFQLGGEHYPVELFHDSISDSALPPTNDKDMDVIAIIYSSGTTDQMKGVKVTYKSVLKAKEVFVRLAGLENYMTYLLVLPFNHIAGFTGAMTFFLTGCGIGFIEDVNASKLADGLQRFQPFYFAMVPKVLEVIEQKIRAKFQEKGKVIERVFNILLKLSGILRKSFGLNLGRKMFKGITSQVFGANIFGIGTGASPCKTSTAEFYLNLGLEWANLYATTETSVPIASTGIHDRYPADSVGNVHAHPEIEIKIRSSDDNGIGEILVKSELIMKGYFRQPELTDSAFEGAYFKTGDYGFIDQKGCLHITGRIKESIVLRTGKKVSPTDVDEYYNNRLSDAELACRGIASNEGTYDEIHIFIEDKAYSNVEREAILTKLQMISRQAPDIYKLTGIHIIPHIPKTAVGKVKRFCLNIEDDIHMASEKGTVEENNLNGQKSIEETLYTIINKIMINDITKKYKSTEKLRHDIGMDSLNIFEMCVALQEQTGVSVEGYLHDSITVGEILNLLKKQDDVKCKVEDITGYPLKKTERTQKNFQLFKRLSNRFWDIEVYGVERIDFTQQYIFCPNHESHFDGLWIMSCLPDTVQEKICSMAADYLFEKKIYRFGVEIMGGIPVHRNGNTTLAMKRIYDCLTKEGYSVLIHPEGTRTRDGKLGNFKLGAARLAKQTGVKCIPVHIKGAKEVYPPDRKFPRLSKKNGNKQKLVIRFGNSINSEGKTEQEITDEIRKWMNA